MGSSHPAGTPPVVTFEVRGRSGDLQQRVLIASGGHHRVTVATLSVSCGHPLALIAASGPALRICPAARAPLTHFQP